MPITQNPTIDFAVIPPRLFYLAEGAPLFGCIGSPEGVVTANQRAVAVSDNNNVYVKTTNNSNTGWVALGGGGGGGVSSVGLALPGEFAISGSPVTSSGTLTGAWNNQLANRIFAGPNTGAPATPAFRALVAADIPGLAAGPTNAVQINNGSNAFDGSAGFTFDPLSNTASLGQSALPGHLRLLAAGGFYNDFVTQALSSNIFWLLPSALPTTTNQALTVSSLPGGGQIGLSWASPWTGIINATDGALPYRSSASQFSDSPLFRESANEIAQRNGLNAQTFRQYFSTDAGFTNYQRLSISQSSGQVNLTAESAGTGAATVNILLNPKPSSTGNVYFGSSAYSVRNDGVATMSSFVKSDNTLALGYHSTLRVSLSSAQYAGWVDTSSALFGTADSSFNRHAANIIRVGNGGSGQGKLFIGNSAGTSFGQLHVESINTSTVCAFFATQSGASSISDLIQGQNGSTQIFQVTAGGKIRGAANQAMRYAAQGTISIDTTTVGNVGASATNLMNISVLANTLSATGDSFIAECAGKFENNGNNKQVEALFGSTVIYNSGSAAFGPSDWRLRCTVTRLTNTTQLCRCEWLSNDVVLQTDIQVVSGAETLSNANTFTIRATGGATNDVTQNFADYQLHLN